MAVGLKFPIYEVKGLCYLCSENEGADQLCSYCTADLRLHFSHMQKAGFLMTRLKYKTPITLRDWHHILLLFNVPVNSYGNVGTVTSDFVELLPDIEMK